MEKKEKHPRAASWCGVMREPCRSRQLTVDYELRKANLITHGEPMFFFFSVLA